VNIVRGACHCGNVTVALETALAPEALPLRACGCTFCRKHGARATSDPAGRIRIDVQEPSQLLRYRFGQRTADFLVCARCGIYVGAVMTEADGAWATLNANTFAEPDRFARAAQPVDYGAETAAERRARRRARWTPVLA